MNQPPENSASSAIWENATVAPSALQTDAELGRYQIVELLGRGGMGEVWKAYDPHRKRHVVIKLLPLLLLGNEAELRRIRESFAKVNALQHQHICPVYDLQTDERAGHYLVMKYLEGETLAVYRFRTVREHGQFPAEKLAEVLRPIALALDYAHGEQIVHRDVKPQNIMVRSDGSDPQLVDFGLADEIRLSTSRVSKANLDISGTYPYMAPEQWRGRQQDGRTDQYALAVVAYELLAGHPPFETADPQIMRMCVLNDPPPPLPQITPAANEVLSRALAKEPGRRFSSCSDFVEALAAALLQQGEAGGQRKGRYEDAKPSRADDTLPPSAAARRVASRSRLVQVAVLMGAVALGGYLFYDPIFSALRGPHTASDTSGSSTHTAALASPADTIGAADPTPAVNSLPVNTASSSDDSGSRASALAVGTQKPSAIHGNPPSSDQSSGSNGSPAAQPPLAPAFDAQLLAQVQQAKELAEQAQREAAGTNTRQYAAAEFSAAESQFTQAQQKFAEADFGNALALYQQAASGYFAAINTTRQAEAFVRGFRGRLQELTALRSKAETAGAEQRAPQAWITAQRADRNMHDLYSAGDYLATAEKFEEQKAALLAAIDEASARQRVETAQTAYETQIQGIAPELLAEHGGTAWKEAVQRIQLAEQGEDLAELQSSYQAAATLLPALLVSVRKAELGNLVVVGNNRQVLNLLWPDWDNLDSEMQRMFFAAARNDPQWWLDQAVREMSAAELPPPKSALLYLAMWDALRRRGEHSQAKEYLVKATEQSTKVTEPRQAMETSLTIAQLVAASGDAKELRDAITQVNVDLNGMAVTNNRDRSEYDWLKYHIPIRCAALLWMVGDKEEADRYSQLAYSNSQSSASFYYDLPAFQALVIYAEAGDHSSLKRMSHVNQGRVHIYHLRGGRPYVSLNDSQIYHSTINHTAHTGVLSYEVIAQAELALAAARIGEQDQFLVHYRNGDALVNQYKAGSSNKWLSSVAHARLAMAEAAREEFVAAAGRLRNEVKDPFALGEASVYLGQRQLRSAAEVKNGSVEGSKLTLLSFADHPRAALLASEIAAATARHDPPATLQWLNSLPEPHLRLAGLVGMAQSPE
jgi:serine/threonine protein kinase